MLSLVQIVLNVLINFLNIFFLRDVNGERARRISPVPRCRPRAAVLSDHTDSARYGIGIYGKFGV